MPACCCAVRSRGRGPLNVWLLLCALAAVPAACPAPARAAPAPAPAPTPAPVPADAAARRALSRLGQYPFGAAYSGSALGDTVVWGHGPILEITDFSRPETPQILSQIVLDRVIVSVLALPGRAYVYCLNVGLVILDISDLTAPRALAVYPTASRIWGMAPWGSYLLAANAAGGLLVLDVSDPTAPQAVGSYVVPDGVAFGLVTDGSLAYITYGSMGVRVVDVSDPTAPREVGRLEGFVTGWGLDKAGDFLYVPVRPQGFYVIDVSDPTAPVLRGQLASVDNGDYAVYRAGHVFVNDFPRGFHVVDVADPDLPSLVGTFGELWPESLFLGRQWMFVPTEGEGMAAIDVADPAAPAEVGRRDDCGYPVGVAASGAYAYLASRFDGLRILDTTDLARPRLCGRVPAYAAYAVAVRDGFAYVAATDAGCLVVDVHDSAAPATVAVLTGSWVDGVALAGDHVYLSDGGYGLRIFDIADPTHPALTGQVSLAYAKHDVAVRAGYAYVAAGRDGVRVVDARNPAAPVLVRTVATGGYCAQIAIDGDLAAAVTGLTGLVLLDLTDPASPAIVGAIDPGGQVRGAALAQGRAYLADELYGLRVYDVTDPAQPLPVGDVPLQSAQRVAVGGHGLIWVTGMEEGLWVVRDDALTPVTLAGFRAERAGRVVRLAWEFAAAEQPARVHVYRQESGGPRVRLTSAPLTDGDAARFTDDDAPTAAADYWLLALASDGGERWFGPAGVPAAGPPALALRSAVPNPFNPRTTLTWSQPQAGHAALRVHDARGRRVATLVDAAMDAGEHTAVWDGRDDRGGAAPAGVYFARLVTAEGVRTRKLVLAR